jgi:thiol:disulfide interchange protein DsbC
MNKFSKLIGFFASILVVLSVAGVSFSAEESGGKEPAKTSEQSSMSREDALTALKQVAPNITVTEIKPSPVAGLWEVDVESGGRKGILYLDSSRKYLIQGSIVDLESKANLTMERFNEINKVDVAQIPLDDAIVMGDKDAPHRVIVFDDPK